MQLLRQEGASERSIRLSAGKYLLDALVLEDANVTLYAAGSGDVVISPTREGRLFEVGTGARLELRGIHVAGERSLDVGALAVREGGAALLSRCTFSAFSSSESGGAILARSAWLDISEVAFVDCASAARGGALFSRSSRVHVRHSSIERCEARYGGAVFVAAGDSGEGPVRLVNSTLSDCRASERGGLVFAAGDVTMADRTALGGGTAGIGSTVFVDSAVVKYELPAPDGHWLPNARCVVFREAYETPCEDGDSQSQCQKERDACALLADVCDGGTCLAPENCTAATFVQPCDWKADASTLGKYLYQLPTAPIDSHFPLPCASGIRGSTNIAHQASRLCAGECPPGTQCPYPATVEPLPCDAGSYCGAGTVVPQPCPSGTYSGSTNLTEAIECAECPIGFHCVAGATAPAPCAAGYYGDAAGASSGQCAGQCAAGHYCRMGSSTAFATPCPSGTYNPYAGGGSPLACLDCPLGFYCPAGTVTPVECPKETIARAAGFGVEMIRQCTCQIGFYLADCADDPLEWSCEECPEEGANCTTAVSLSSLPSQLGWWRHTNCTTDFHKCAVSGDDSPCSAGPEAGSASCAEGYAGPRCEVCAAPRHYFDLLSASCRPCGSLVFSLAKIAALVVSLGALVGGFSWVIASDWMPKRRLLRDGVQLMRRNALLWRQSGMTSKMKIIIAMVQCIWAAPYVYEMDIPEEFESLLGLFGSAQPLPPAPPPPSLTVTLAAAT